MKNNILLGESKDGNIIIVRINGIDYIYDVQLEKFEKLEIFGDAKIVYPKNKLGN